MYASIAALGTIIIGVAIVVAAVLVVRQYIRK